MIRFLVCDEFEKDIKWLSKRYFSLKEDLDDLRKALAIDPAPFYTERINNLWEHIILPVYKVKKFLCRSLKSNSKLRIIYVYDATKQEIQFIQFIEIYAKADKGVEDRDRINKYCLGKQSLSE